MKKITSFIMLMIVSSGLFAEEKILTQPILMLGDTQEHERHGTFVLVAGSLIDKITKVAARSPQVDFYSKYLTQYIINNKIGEPSGSEISHPEAHLAIHLGDFLDISCVSEWNRFLAISNKDILSGKMILGLGNHDGFYIGNYAFNDMKSHAFVGDQSWRERCSAGPDHNEIDSSKNIMHKGKLVKEIVTLLSSQKVNQIEYIIGKQCSTNMICGNLQVTNNWKVYFQYPSILAKVGTNPKNDNGDLDNQGEYWRSYLLSEVKLPSIDKSVDARMIILDPSQASSPSESFWSTVSYEVKFAKLFKVNVILGNIQNDQRALVNNILKQKCSVGVSKCLRILAGHHPLKDFGFSSMSWIENLILAEKKSEDITAPKILNLYISAHTHSGYVDKYHGVNQINVGSLIENDPSYRLMWLSQDTVTKDYIVHSPLKTLRSDSGINCSNDIEYLPEYSKRKMLGNNIDKYRYLEQSRKELMHELDYLQSAAEHGNREAALLWTGDSKKYNNFDIVSKQMNVWSESVVKFNVALVQKRKKNKDSKTFIGYHCKKKNTSNPQSIYWDQKNYKSGVDVRLLLEKMANVTNHIGTENLSVTQCEGRNTANGQYLAYTEGMFLSLMQAWFEQIDDSAFSSENTKTDSFRICSARLAAYKDATKEEFKPSAYISDITLK